MLIRLKKLTNCTYEKYFVTFALEAGGYCIQINTLGILLANKQKFVIIIVFSSIRQKFQ